MRGAPRSSQPSPCRWLRPVSTRRFALGSLEYPLDPDGAKFDKRFEGACGGALCALGEGVLEVGKDEDRKGLNLEAVDAGFCVPWLLVDCEEGSGELDLSLDEEGARAVELSSLLCCFFFLLKKPI